MYSCILHGWNSHDGPCPTCQSERTITSTVTDFTITSESPSGANVLVEIEKAKIKMLEEMKDWARDSMDAGATGDEILFSHNDFFSDMDTWIERCEEKIIQYNAATPQTPIDREPEEVTYDDLHSTLWQAGVGAGKIEGALKSLRAKYHITRK